MRYLWITNVTHSIHRGLPKPPALTRVGRAMPKP